MNGLVSWFNGISRLRQEGSRVRKEIPEEGRRAHRPKRCTDINKNEDNSPKIRNTTKYIWTFVCTCICVCVFIVMWKIIMYIYIYIYICIYIYTFLHAVNLKAVSKFIAFQILFTNLCFVGHMSFWLLKIPTVTGKKINLRSWLIAKLSY